MNAFDMDAIARAVERECSLVQFNEDHGAKNERRDEMMLKSVTTDRKLIKTIKNAASEEIEALDAEMADEVAAHNAKMAALTARKAKVQESCDTAVATAQSRIKQAKAYIAAGA